MPWDDRTRRRLKLRDLDILMAVVQAGSMGKAAERLNMSQSAVSKSIADLEHTLGVHLLDRSRRGIEPTMYGRALDRCGVTIFDDLRQGLKLIEFLSDPTVGELRIGTTPALAAAVMPAIIEQLSRQYPCIAFHVAEGDTTVLFRELHERKMDLLVTRLPASVDDEYFEAQVLFLDALVVAAGAQNPWTRRRKVRLAELVNEPWALSPADGYIGSLVVEAFRASGLDLPPATVFTTSIHLRNNLLAGGRFMTLMPHFALQSLAKNKSLKALPIQLPTTRRPVGVVTLRNRTISPVAQLFIDCAREVAKSIAVPAQTRKS
jgi:DNA-binding transcriptional LysR family regulator